jgi:hypothetical protein
MIDYMIYENLCLKFIRELAKGNREGMRSVMKRLEDLEKEHGEDSLGTMVYFSVTGMKGLIYDKKK